MSILKIIAPIAFLLLSAPSRQRTRPIDKSIPSQDIDSYEKAGPYELERGPGGELPTDRIDKERAWIWSHWTERHLGLLMEVSYSIEGDRAAFFYFVEPDRDGRWRIGIKVERLEGDRVKLGCNHFRVETFSAYVVSRAEKHENAQGKHALVPLEENRSPGEYILLFADKDGKELAQF
jgi:hypothetical protein